MKNVGIWLIIPQTNLHVGSESTVNFSVIDKAIQRDVTTNLPCINSSSLKGAIKEYMSECANMDVSNLKDIFGSVKSDSADIKKGSVLFFDASLLFIPKQCGEGKTYELVYSDKVLEDFSKKVNNLVEGNSISKETLLSQVRSIMGQDNVARNSIDRDTFTAYCDDDALPIISRNCLENGESVNLWYEQVLPSLSVLATIIVTKEKEQMDALNGKIVQIGANATIGYGYCKFVKIN
ncbi:RAMP superfamily CRISPR-associated protein [Phocaeicola plebeius]|jgi:CRISPR-associated protein Cmr4|uniref:RAMP superfamily CRISPR-associated protein n=1 Tax=Phocaeicola plebeius TaxID=310297 RepID=UPI00307F4C18